jgi:hypothetical protein
VGVKRQLTLPLRIVKRFASFGVIEIHLSEESD